MPTSPIDPAPRAYPPWVTLMRRTAGGPATAPAETTVSEISAWLLGDAVGIDDLQPLFESLVWRLLAAGLPLDRASLHAGTLHPQVIGFAWNWNRADGFCDEVKVGAESLQTDAYKRNPLSRVIEFGEAFRGKPQDPATAARYPLMADLAAQGMTDYLTEPLRAGGAYHNAVTAATRQAGGFNDRQLADLRQILRIFALHVERHVAARIAGNVLDAYLGAAAGKRVLGGSIRRGSGEPISAVIWVSDMRGFTDLADRLDGTAMIALLNAYFERLVAAVIAHDGEVLKYIGDGLLAVFPFSAFPDENAAAEASLAAAREALAAVARLDTETPAEIAEIDGWRPLRTGIALHEGEVIFGNVGAPERLDFTVIGRAVNETARVEALTKALGRPILITGPVAARLDAPLDHLGEHALRGLAGPVSLYSPGP